MMYVLRKVLRSNLRFGQGSSGSAWWIGRLCVSGWASSRPMVLCAGIAATAVVLAGCASKIEGKAQPALEDGTISAIDPTKAPRSSSRPTTTESPDRGGQIDFEAEIGDCVTLGGTTTNATIEKASCGSRASNYKVIGKAERSSQCVSDADNYYAESLNGVEQGALCLDIDWVVGGCMDVGGSDPKRIDCTESAAEGVKVVSIERNATDVSACGSGSAGYVYSERRFVVCVEEF